MFCLLEKSTWWSGPCSLLYLPRQSPGRHDRMRTLQRMVPSFVFKGSEATRSRGQKQDKWWRQCDQRNQRWPLPLWLLLSFETASSRNDPLVAGVFTETSCSITRGWSSSVSHREGHELAGVLLHCYNHHFKNVTQICNLVLLRIELVSCYLLKS